MITRRPASVVPIGCASLKGASAVASDEDFPFVPAEQKPEQARTR